MNRKLGVGLLIVCFGFSNVNVVLASEVVNVPPIIVQPYANQPLVQQGLDQDRKNRDEEIEIRNVVQENDKLIREVLAHQQDANLARIDQVMNDYENKLYARDQERILANGQHVSPRYASLVALTEDADAMTQDNAALANKDALLAQKYQMLETLKDEMVALNDKLRNQDAQALNQKDKIIAAYKNLVEDQQSKIQLLVQRLSEMDQRLSHFDAIIAQKDQQIQALNSNLSMDRNELATKDDTIKELQAQMAVLLGESKEISFRNGQLKSQIDDLAKASGSTDNSQLLIASLKDQVQKQEADLKSKDQLLKEQGDQIAFLQKDPKSSLSAIANVPSAVPANQDEMIKEKDELIKSQNELLAQYAKKLNEAPAAVVMNHPAAANQDQDAVIKEKDELIKSQAAQLADVTKQAKDHDAAYSQVQDEITGLRNRLHQQDLDLKAKNDSLRWLNQVLAAAKDKADFYKISSQKDRLSLQQVKSELSNIKDDLSEHLKNFDRFENVIVDLKGQVSRLRSQLADKQNQVDLLKSELANRITKENDQSQQDAQLQQDLKEQLKAKQDLIIKLKDQIQSIQADEDNKEQILKNAATQAQDRVKLARQLIDLQEQEAQLLDEKNSLVAGGSTTFEQRAQKLEADIRGVLGSHHSRIANLKNRMAQLSNELGQKEDVIDQLNANLRDKVAQLKDQTAMDYEITDLKDQIDHLNDQLHEKQTEIGNLQDQIHSRHVTEQEVNVLKVRLSDQENNLQTIKQEFDSKVGELNRVTLLMEDYKVKFQTAQGTQAQVDVLKAQLAAQESKLDQLEVALRQKITREVNAQIDALNQELTDEKSKVELLKQNLNDKIGELNRANLKIDEYKAKLQTLQETEGQVDTLKQELAGQENRMGLLTAELKERIAQAKTQKVLEFQIQDLKSQFNDKQKEIAALKAEVLAGQETQAQTETLMRQLSDEQNKAQLLRQELESRSAQNDQMTQIIADYQKKLEAKDSAYNDQLRQTLIAKKNQSLMEAQINELNSRLQDEEAQLVKVKKEMYDLQQAASSKDQDAQARDLSLSIAQQKLMNEKINDYQQKIDGLQAADKSQLQVIADLKAELALARQKVSAMPSNDEIEFLKSGLKKATSQLQEKDAMLLQIKANAAEYEKQFKDQTSQFESLKMQLQDALNRVDHKTEDLKYKNLELIRFKEQAKSKEADLQDQVGVLSWKLDAANKKLNAKGVVINKTVVVDGGNKAEALQAQLDQANLQIKDLQNQLDALKGSMTEDRLREKLKQALDKIDSQGRYINELVQKLHDAGQAGNLTAVTPHD